MGLAKSRNITITVALTTLTSNIVSSLLFAQLPDDPYHLARNFGLYLHFANVLSVFGFVGALRKQPQSISLFANYLLLDTVLFSIPRILTIALLQTLSSTICSPTSSASSSTLSSQNTILDTQPPPQAASRNIYIYEYHSPSSPSEHTCRNLVLVAQVMLGAVVLVATVLQFLGALSVREYARVLKVREVLMEGEGVAMGERFSEIEEERVVDKV